MRVVPLSIAVLMAFAFAAAAQDFSRHQHGSNAESDRNVGHAENHEWYKDLKQPGTGYSCCNGNISGPNGVVIEGDCRPTRAFLTEEGTWKALINGRWTPVPPRVVLQKLAPDGNSHICAGKSGMIYCFIGGSPKS
jgi:hypothetical protein